MITQLIPAIVIDVVAISILAYGIYYRRHRRQDLLLAYVALNIGVLAVTVVLSNVIGSMQAGIGLGLGLFGVLSIIRLRSDQISQGEIAYYFVSLALGLLAGLQSDALWVTPLFSALLVAVMYIVDHPRLSRRAKRQIVTLDRAHLDEEYLSMALAELLQARVDRVIVLQVDLVRDVTVVDVRYRTEVSRSRGQATKSGPRNKVAAPYPNEQAVASHLQGVR